MKGSKNSMEVNIPIYPDTKDIEQMNHASVKEYYNSVNSKIYRSLDYFKTRENEISKLLQDSIGKSILDIGAGDGFWVEHFIDKINVYIAVEQSNNNCQSIETKLCSCEKEIHILNVNAFQFEYSNIDVDTLLFCFFISHFDISSIIKLIQKINQNVNFNKIIILDSFWSEHRKIKYIDNNLQLQKRIINKNGDTVEIPKRYITIEDLHELSSAMKMKQEIKYIDEYWCFALLTSW